MPNGQQMETRETNRLIRNLIAFVWMIAVCCGLGALTSNQSQSAGKTPDSQKTAQKQFRTPQEAAEALIEAAGVYNVSELEQILGPTGEDLVSSEDPVRDKSIAVAFAAMAREKHAVDIDPENPARATLSVGDDKWPLPIPIVKRNGKWIFDTKAGRQEMLFRRIGANELDAIEICRGYIEAQKEYSLEKHDGAQVNQYAQRIISTPGKHDGLVWRNSDGTLQGPISDEIAKALAEGYSDRSQPYHGYYFKILKGQGPAARLGQMDFVIEGAMIGGVALAAAPAEYRVTGVKTFIVDYDGIVYEKDFGPNTLQNFRSMDRFNPDKTWKPTNAGWPPSVFDSDATTETR
ncbi:DUF2950 domain-containing protein [Edaphobacter sp. HDX4]|uniref:DUF2950 domain-containing protein n=1 Tax=Edaphobacter sp. HDX4 TaxID=2794064 RepID=UPI002FE5F404